MADRTPRRRGGAADRGDLALRRSRGSPRTLFTYPVRPPAAGLLALSLLRTMFVAASLVGLSLVLLGAHTAPRLAPVTQALGVVVIGYVLGYDFWHADAGPIPLTLDRAALGLVALIALWRLATGRHRAPTPIGLDWAIALVLAWLSISCVLNRPPDGVGSETSPLFRLVVSFWAPACLYAVLRTAPLGPRDARRLLVGLGALGVYLAVTALCETLGLWAIVFPRYIADPELGLHYGRARGPALNSVSLGVYLGVCATAAWLLVPRSSRAGQLFWLGAAGLMGLGVLLTYTRSTWIGLAGAAVVVVSLQLPKPWRLTAFASAIVLGGLALGVGKDALVGLEREDSGAVSAHSVQQRTAFAYVSMRMFADHPLAGVGFGRFFDKKLPYLTDRRQSFELESLRDLHHHNTLLSLLTETGMLGLVAYLAVLGGFGRAAWRLAHDESVDPECRRLGLLGLGALVVYLPSAVFHDLTLLHTDQWLLFTVCGSATGCWLTQCSPAPAPVATGSPAPLSPSPATPRGWAT